MTDPAKSHDAASSAADEQRSRMRGSITGARIEYPPLSALSATEACAPAPGLLAAGVESLRQIAQARDEAVYAVQRAAAPDAAQSIWAIARDRARLAARIHGRRSGAPGYLRDAVDDSSWEPHEWVLEAIVDTVRAVNRGPRPSINALDTAEDTARTTNRVLHHALSCMPMPELAVGCRPSRLSDEAVAIVKAIVALLAGAL